MLVISGTNRPDSVTRRVAGRAVAELAKHTPTELLDLAELKPDIFVGEAYGAKPGWFVEKYQRAIDKADGILVVVPEYNGSFPGVLKYFIDMLKFPESLRGVPAAFIGLAAGQFGAVRAVEQIEMVFNYRSAHLFGERLFIPAVHEQVAADGSLGDLEERFAKMISNFVSFTKALRSGRA